VYLALIPLIVQRLELLSLTPRQFTPDYWINMGAMAITTLAGTLLIAASERWQFLQQVDPFLLGLSLLFWAGATWWIPLLILLEAWRHVIRHVRLVYSAEYWSAVFPVGMYAACTFQLVDLVHLSVLMMVAEWLVYVASGLWALVFMGLAWHVFGAARVAVQGLHMHLSERRAKRPA
jgi:tellurite resistance protein TehA-like permease